MTIVSDGSSIDCGRDEFASEDEEVDPLWLRDFVPDKFECYVWHFDMLHHTVRNFAFGDAFRRLPLEALGGTVLDIGCGSGLLGMMLLTQRPECNHLHVISIEADKSLARVAVDNARAMGLSSRLEVCHCLSTNLRSLSARSRYRVKGQSEVVQKDENTSVTRASLLVCEILDSALLGEGVLSTLRHAASALLAPNYRAVPSRAKIWGVVVESDFLRQFHQWPASHDFVTTPAAWQSDVCDARPHEVNAAELFRTGKARKLTHEFQALVVDFETLPPANGQHIAFSVSCVSSGRMDAVIFWWRCDMLRDDDVNDMLRGMTNAPADLGGSADHWRQAVCMLSPSKHGRRAESGKTVRVHVSQNDELIWFRVESERREAMLLEDATRVKQRSTEPSERTTSIASCSAWRFRMLNDPSRKWLLRSTASAVRRSSPGHCVVLSDGGIMTFLCLASSGTKGAAQLRKLRPRTNRRLRRLLLATSKNRRERSNALLQKPTRPVFSVVGGNRPIVADLLRAFRRSKGIRFQLCPRRPRIILRSENWVPSEDSVDVLVSEPYDESVEERECDLQLWQHWANVEEFRPSLRATAFVWPAQFRIRIVAVECEPLWLRRRPVGETLIGGVNVSCMDRLASPSFFPWANLSAKLKTQGNGRARHPSELWQQTHRVLCIGKVGEPLEVKAVTLCEVDVREPLRPLSFEAVRLDLSAFAGATVHGLATWTEVRLAQGDPAEVRGAPKGSWWSSALFEDESGDGRGLRFAPGAFKQGLLLAHSARKVGDEADVCGGGRVQPGEEGNGGEASQPMLKRARLSPRTRPDLVVRAQFDPAKGQLRLAASWTDGASF
eukprot:TRINITY_DN61863_c0_g1_i1.p1 TRINITY_DN61863_c0_g1~~TRINITY_DN61863_c0_g1_i1.p1  ORF type:complete len:838 (-),score=109.54 TRINITY_DN61863_c0_g1_i1:21-2534(-)